MARKHDKMRPYRIDYLEISEIESEQVYVHSQVVRAVTAADAKRDYILNHNEAVESLGVPGRIPVRIYRYYEGMSRDGIISKRPTSILKLFSPAKWPEVSSQIVQSLDYAEESLSCPHGYTKDNPGTVHDCVIHSAADYKPVPTVTQPITVHDPGPNCWSGGLKIPITGPDSPATKAALADLQGMVDHDAHEQLMDNFMPDAVPAGHQLPDPKNEPFREINLDEAAPVVPMDASTDPANDEVFGSDELATVIPSGSSAIDEASSRCCNQLNRSFNLRNYAFVGGIVLIFVGLIVMFLIAVHK